VASPSIPPPAASLLEPGFRLDRYELLCKIGQGGMATVWLAHEDGTADGVYVALKTILPEHAANDAFRAMMVDEARIVRAIRHPNVAATLEVGEVFGAPYLVLEHVVGESLDQLSDALKGSSREIPPAILVRILSDVCAGAHAAHELKSPDGVDLGLVHRDLSPQNVLVDHSGRVKLIDFGVAKAAERLAPETQSGVMKGKIPFMAPEQARGDDVDRRADVWAIGAIAYYLLAKAYPHDGPNDAARLIKRLTGDAPEPLPERVPEALRAVVMRALCSDPDGRHATAAELATALEEAVPPATEEDVARFFADTLGSTQRAHALVVDHAIAAAATRARARELFAGGATAPTSVLPPPPDDAPSGVPRRRSTPVFLYAVAAAVVAFAAFVLGSVTTRPKPSGAPTAPLPETTASTAGTQAPSSTAIPLPPVHAADAAPRTSASASAPWPYTWPPPSASANATDAGKPRSGKDAEVEDTIF
jgi:serine/threonine-protein kinase